MQTALRRFFDRMGPEFPRLRPVQVLDPRFQLKLARMYFLEDLQSFVRRQRMQVLFRQSGQLVPDPAGLVPQRLHGRRRFAPIRACLRQADRICQDGSLVATVPLAV
ncbi:MAG TPA: hypothetical protein VLR45_01675, partial [Desulfoprunum sp.]|nr:hypothetical protein [Desulfoprunum sp.]